MIKKAITMFPALMLGLMIASVALISAARRSRVLRGVFHGFSQEARTRGFPSPPFGGFGFVVVIF